MSAGASGWRQGNALRPVRRLLDRCLDKDPKRRLRDIGDARAEIEDAVTPTTELATPIPGSDRGAGRTGVCARLLSVRRRRHDSLASELIPIPSAGEAVLELDRREYDGWCRKESPIPIMACASDPM